MPLENVNVFSAAIDPQTPIITQFDALMEQEMVCWKWFLYAVAVTVQSTTVM